MTNFEIQMRVWGYAVEGVGDFSTRIAEPGWSQDETMWDAPETLETVTLNGQRPADYYALWWVCEHIRRGLEEVA